MSIVENKKLIQDAFTAWANGDGMAFFNLLTDTATWTVMGSCPISGTYVGRQRLVEDALTPQREKLAGPPTPTVINEGSLSFSINQVAAPPHESRARTGSWSPNPHQKHGSARLDPKTPITPGEFHTLQTRF
jgi:hypothetical protein